MSKKLSPNEKHELNKKNYAAYVANIKATDGKFPINQFGDVNLTLIAKECGFLRDVFQKPSSELAKQLAKDIKKIGTKIKDMSEKESSLKKQKEEASRNASKLSKDLERVTAEVYKLREKVTELEQENNALKGKSEAHDSMLDDGRRRFVWD